MSRHTDRDRQTKETPTRQPSTAEQDYLKVIHRLGGCNANVSPADIAGVLNVRPPSVTGMLKHLAAARWVRYHPGVGARLTKKGIYQARQVIRRHRLVELFLTRVLGYDWSEVDAEAEALEHAVSPQLEQAIAKYLGDPRLDPHGHPIPTADGELEQHALRPLTAVCAGQQMLIRQAADDDPARLRHWQAIGLVPGVTVSILSFRPLDDLFQIRVGNRIICLGIEGLQGLFGEEVNPSEATVAA